MPKMSFDPETNSWSSDEYTDASFNYSCNCGQQTAVKIGWPKGVTVESEVTLSSATCPSCEEVMVLSKAHYYVEDGFLKSRPITE